MKNASNQTKKPLRFSAEPEVKTRAVKTTKKRVTQSDEFEVTYDLCKYPLVGETTRVGVSLSVTQPVGDGCFVKAQISIDAPCQSNSKAVKNCKGRLSQLIAKMLEDEINNAKDSL